MDDLDNILLMGSLMSKGKMRIYALYLHETDPSARVSFLRKEYGTGGRSYQLLDGRRGFVDYGKGISLECYKDGFHADCSWGEADKRISRMVDKDVYFDDRDWEEWFRLEEKYAAVGGVPYPSPAFRFPEPEEIIETMVTGAA